MTMAASQGVSAPKRGLGPAPDPIPGEFVGRYLVLSRLGAGAMGVVFAAYDPELDRRVAVKLLRGFHSDPEADTRLQREAQALARLNHPNVVGVHDVGSHEGRVFLAMEYVEGQTLTQWMRAKSHPRPWRELVRVFAAAGQGLAAAHARELAHRDFKPDNVMLGDDGRVRVMDFGLARATNSATPRERGPADVVDVERSLSLRLTQTGAMLGTPAYMAAEQFAGELATERSDQFSFCVALFEALYGERPFRGDTAATLAASVTQGEIEVVTGPRRVPAWLRRVVCRGLARDPAARFDGMQPLLDALTTGEQHRRRRRWWLAGAGAVAVLGGVWGFDSYGTLRRERACVAAGGEIDQVWSESAEVGVRAGIMASGALGAEQTADKTTPWIDRYADRWREHRVTVCRHRTVTKDWDDALARKAVQCLEDRRLALSFLVADLAAAGKFAASGAVNAAAALADTSACIDVFSLEATPALPADARAELADARQSIARARVLRSAGRYADALDAGRAALAVAEGSGSQVLLAEAKSVTARSLMHRGAFEESEALGEQAYWIAARAGAWAIAAEAANHLIYVVGYRMHRPSEGRRWAEHCAVAIALAGDPSELLEADRQGALAAVANRESRFGEAIDRNARAREIYERRLGPAHPMVARRLSNEGNNHRRRDEYAEAAAKHHASLEIREQTLGSHHPDVANGLNNLANVYWSMGDPGSAEPLYRRALEIRRRTLDHEHPLVATALHNMAMTQRALGKLDEASEASEEALALREAKLGPQHPDVASSLELIGGIAYDQGELARARVAWESSREIYEAAFGVDHPSAASVLHDTSELHLRAAEYVEAIAAAEMAIQRASLAPESHLPIARARFVLARGLWMVPPESGGDRDRARAVAREAIGELEGLGGRGAIQRAEIQAWLSGRDRAANALPTQLSEAPPRRPAH